ncbi:MAG TPA: serine/threonine-protein kinase, partial [Thermomicrobiaceae bacterium]|nr:serine/threonine-protein kinase [Thermomicrobiaceae bacterium]
MFESQGPEALIGRTFNGYRVTRFVARGGMGIVYAGVQESLDRPVAIKFLYPHLSDDDRFRERFEREARFASRMVHPNIVRVLDFGTEGMLHFMVLDLVDGDSLRDRLAQIFGQGLTMRTETILRILEQVGSALAYAHKLGYIHRDVKPGNILLTPDGNAYLTDFGVVKMMGTGQVTSTGMIIGTPEYMSPEQSAGVSEITPAADQYSLAVVAYEMLVGRAPFQAPTPAAVMRMQLSDPPPPPSTVAPWFPSAVEQVLMRALAKDPRDRYESVGDFIAALSAAVLQAREVAGGTLTREPAIHSATVLDEPNAGVAGPAAVPGAALVAGGGPRRYAIAGGASVLVLLLALGGYFAFGGRGNRSNAGGGSTPTATATRAAAAAPPTAT